MIISETSAYINVFFLLLDCFCLMPCFSRFLQFFSSTTTQAISELFLNMFLGFFGHWSWFMILDSFSTPYQRHPASDSQHIRRRVSGPKPISQLQVQLRPELDGSWNGTPTGHWIPLKDGEKYGNRIAKMGFPKIGKDWEHMGHIFETSKPMWFWIFWGSKCWHNCNCRCRWWGRGANSTWGENRSKGVQNSIFPLRNSLLRNPEKVWCVSGSWSESNLLAGGFNMFSYFWFVANNFQCVDDISYMFIHFMLWLCQRVFSALRVAWSWPNASLSVIRGSSGVVSTQNVQLARNCNCIM